MNWVILFKQLQVPANKNTTIKTWTEKIIREKRKSMENSKGWTSYEANYEMTHQKLQNSLLNYVAP
jgi:hypothetical protein